MPLLRYAKALGAVLVAVVTAVIAALTDNFFTAQEGVVVAGVGVSAVGVAIVPNLAAGVAAYAKAIVAFLGAGLGAVAVLMAGGLTLAEVLEAVVAAAAAVGIVAAVPNANAVTYVPRARGGVVSASAVRGVGEDGPETWAPTQSGRHIVSSTDLPDTGR
jgi:hypothetical protein